MTHPRTVAIITARGGSKGLPGKNWIDLGGKPLIAHSIQAALDSPVVDRVIVTTEDPRIRAVALAWGAEVVDRPAELATDTALSSDVVRHALEALRAEGEAAELLMLLQPTSPLRDAAHITDCFERFRSSGMACAISVTEEPHSPYKDFLLGSDGALTPLFGNDRLSAPRQSLPPVYRQNGAIYLLPVATFLDTGQFYVAPAFPYIMPADASIDIDTATDLMLAELILRSSRHSRFDGVGVAESRKSETPQD